MSEVAKNVVKIHSRVVKFDEDGTPLEEHWLCAHEDDSYDPPKRKWYLRRGIDYAFDFKATYGDKAQTYALSISKVTKVVKEKLKRKGWKLEIVFVREVTRRTVTVLTDNPMAVIALAALDD